MKYLHSAPPKIDKTKSAEGGQRGREAAARFCVSESKQKGKIFVP